MTGANSDEQDERHTRRTTGDGQYSAESIERVRFGSVRSFDVANSPVIQVDDADSETRTFSDQRAKGDHVHGCNRVCKVSDEI